MRICLLSALLCPILLTLGAAQRNTNDVNGQGPANEELEIQNLPGVNFELNFKHYSGFLQVSPTHFLHYWFVESQNSPANDPLIFWFNGGPGCSSVDGLLNEMGPYVANNDGKTLRQNPNAWNKLGNVVYIEAPAGVGYSYSTDGNITTDDDLTSQENYEAIKQFHLKHPNFRNHSTFITGESYGGIYVPTLTARIVDGQADYPINLKGMAIGNGYVDGKLNIDTSVRYAYGHGIIDEKIWNTLELECCRGCIDGCDLTQLSGHCARLVEDTFEFLWHGGLNPYDLYRNCDPSPSRNSHRARAMQSGLMPPFLAQRFAARQASQSPNDYTPMLGRRPIIEPQQHLLGGGVSVPCLNDSDLTTYMNNAQVRQALHIPENLPEWSICSADVGAVYKNIYQDMAPFVQKIVKANVRVLLYYGDTDMACNFMMGQQFASKLGYKRVISKQPWKFDRQIAGFKTLYKGGAVTFLTIRGAGHMAPQWKAPQMYYAMQQFLVNHPI